MSQNDHKFNKVPWNNYFVPDADAIGRQVLTKKQLDEKRNQIDGDARTYIREGAILAQDTIGVEPTQIRRDQTRSRVRRTSITFRVYENIPFALKKTIKYLNLHRNRVMRQDGSFVQAVNNKPNVQPVLSSPPSPSDLDRLYDAQFKLPDVNAGMTFILDGPTGSRRGFPRSGMPLPNAIDRREFRLRHDIRNLPKLTIESMRRRGLDDSNDLAMSRGRTPVRQSLVVPPTAVTRLEQSCLQGVR